MSLMERIHNGERLISDGALGTMLFDRGLKFGACPEEMSLSKPHILQEIAMAYINAGADIIQANTFGASPLKLSDYQLQDRVMEINLLAVKNLREIIALHAQTIARPIYIAGTCGPSGKLLKPYGKIDPVEMFASYKQQMQALVDADVDIILIETMSDLNEVTLAVNALHDVFSETGKVIPVCVSMTYNATKRGLFTIMGSSITNVVTTLNELKVDMMGSNCGNGIETMLKVAQEYRTLTDKPLFIESNAGLPVVGDDGKTHYLETPELFAEKSQQFLNLGINVIGGCCGTSPEHIRALKTSLCRSH